MTWEGYELIRALTINGRFELQDLHLYLSFTQTTFDSFTRLIRPFCPNSIFLYLTVLPTARITEAALFHLYHHSMYMLRPLVNGGELKAQKYQLKEQTNAYLWFYMIRSKQPF